MESEGEIFTPDRFIPLIAQFNLSHRFDMCVMEKLLLWLRDHPSTQAGARFSVNLMPLTLMQKEVATEICALFERYGVAPQAVVIEITEEQAFSNSGTASTIFSSCGITVSGLPLMILVPATPTTSASDACRRTSLKLTAAL
jgi:EAL domain-containing protein (putative c-di-GMP-specific phosphodiesterase class I)